MPQAILALGSNQANPKENLDRAITALSALGTVKEVAPYILSEPEGYDTQPDFVNTVLILSTPYGPVDLLRKLKELETQPDIEVKNNLDHAIVVTTSFQEMIKEALWQMKMLLLW